MGNRMSHRNPRKLFFALALATIAALGAPAWAGDTPGDREEAMRLRVLGEAAMDRGDLAEALDLLQLAYRVYPSPNSRYNIGVALDRLGRSGEAVEAFEDFLARVPNAPEEVRRVAEKRAAELATQIGRLTIVASPSDSRVTVDGRLLAVERRRDLPLMPGKHEIVAERTGYLSLIEHVSIAAGEARSAALTLAELPTVASPPSQDPAPHPDAATNPQRPRLRAASIAVGSLGLALLGAGTAFAALTAQANQDLNSPQPNSQFDFALAGRARTYEALEQSFLVVGSVALVGGIVGFVLTRREPRRARAAATAPVPL
jgi:tetratricopeptide (TPR) repeat protein